MEVTNIDVASIVLKDGEFRDELLTFTGGDTYVKGTILARDSATGKLVAFDPDDVGEVDHEVAKAVLTYDVTASGAGDVAIRALVKGVVDASRLVIDDGAAVTAAHLDQLRDYGITPIDAAQLARIDNPQS